MTENIANALIPILKLKPLHPDSSISLTADALRELGWQSGEMCRLWVDKANNRMIITNSKNEDDSTTNGNGTQAGGESR